MIKFGNYVIRYNSSWLGVGDSPTPPTPTLPSDMDFVYYANDFTGSYIPNSAPNSTFGNYMAQGTLYKNGSGANCYLSSNWWEIEEGTPGFLKKELTQTELDNIMANNGTYTFFIRVMNDMNDHGHYDVGGIMSCRYLQDGYIYMIRSNGNQLQIHTNGGKDLGNDFLISLDNVYKVQISGNYYYVKNLSTGNTWSLNDESEKSMGGVMTTFTAWNGNENNLDRFYAMAGIARTTTEEEDAIIKNCIVYQTNTPSVAPTPIPTPSSTTITCPDCNGSGTTWVTCSHCGGGGVEPNSEHYEPCYECNGSGVCDYGNGEEPCGSCGGSGQITSSDYCSVCNGSGGQDVTCSTCGGTGRITNPNA